MRLGNMLPAVPSNYPTYLGLANTILSAQLGLANSPLLVTDTDFGNFKSTEFNEVVSLPSQRSTLLDLINLVVCRSTQEQVIRSHTAPIGMIVHSIKDIAFVTDMHTFRNRPKVKHPRKARCLHQSIPISVIRIVGGKLAGASMRQYASPQPAASRFLHIPPESASSIRSGFGLITSSATAGRIARRGDVSDMPPKGTATDGAGEQAVSLWVSGCAKMGSHEGPPTQVSWAMPEAVTSSARALLCSLYHKGGVR